MKTGTVILWLSILLANPSTAVPIQGASEMLAPPPLGTFDNQSPLDSKTTAEKPKQHMPKRREEDTKAALLATRGGGGGHMPGHIKTVRPRQLGLGYQYGQQAPGTQIVRLKNLPISHLSPDAIRTIPIPVKSGPEFERLKWKLASGKPW